MQDSYWEEYLPMALECGMSPTQFWKGEPRLLNSYIRKHEKELDEFNYKSWLLNIYTHDAVITAIGKCFGEKGKDINYLEKPIEELFINKPNIQNEKVELTKENLQSEYRRKTNYWAKFGKKGGKK